MRIAKFHYGVLFDFFAESILDLLGSHRVEDIREALVGLSLQVVRLVIYNFNGS